MNDEMKKIVDLAQEENPIDLTTTVKDILLNKTVDIINTKKTEIANDYFTSKESEDNE